MRLECPLNPIYELTYFLKNVYIGQFYSAEVKRGKISNPLKDGYGKPFSKNSILDKNFCIDKSITFSIQTLILNYQNPSP